MSELIPTTALIKDIARLTVNLTFPFGDIFFGKNKKISLREQQLLVLKELTEAKIDPHLFDLLLTNELDRNLKKNFGIAFLIATVFFALLSYGIVVANSVYKWGISDFAIGALIIETPIQFIGLLYIIARNLFPQGSLPNQTAQHYERATRIPANASRVRARGKTTAKPD